ncbi:SDR family oxidoreductase [Serratia symbiotica]|uniref:SDR family oxidoreductase n=2 Tax=Serratia symbiotica TaxID=138074 RepID=A0A068Z5S2_9GAMM|nr:SDR family oxidoreductase [Serratia symbiotica]MBF1994837.1 SDR family oxidoreductase [Serratia symbiotica]MBQ0954470.1 SDR family oxidoreductase [Serratia symbiotica]QLH63526.1 SDR family oxidoreductase [Serratia symbiotica]QTP13920.1 SDR family oxidoreductase [Serratia symbiotica]CDS58844.1 putative enzyme [Serratia symbiotica]
MMNSITEKVVVITGASSGLGEATARLLSERGAKVVLAARRADRLENLAKDIKKAGGEALTVITDVAKRDDMENLIRSAEEKFGRVDVLVNNAGVMSMAAMSKRKVEEWDLMIDVNIKGVLYGIAAVLPGMLNNKSGHIINLSSVAGLRVFAGVGTVYSATKFAVKAISEGLRAEVGASGVKVTTLYPGAVASELVNGSSDAEASSAMKAFYENYEISADSIARAIAYAVEQPDDVSINEITLRPTSQEF